MPHTISDNSSDLLFTVNVTWTVQAGKDVNEMIQLNVNGALICLALELEWIPKSANPICKLCLTRSRCFSTTSESDIRERTVSGLKLCSVWAHFNNSGKHYLSKQPSLEEWMSDPLDSSSHGILENDKSSKTVNLALWIQVETCNDKVAMSQFQRLLKEQIHCDVQFLFEDGIIGSHVAILAARCQVFAAMFKHDTREKQSREIKIQDIEKEVFYELLNYIYSGQASDNLSITSAQTLYEAADKYCMDDLKVACLNFLSTQFEISNVIQILVWAHFHSASSLKKQAIDYMSCNSEEVAKLAEWEDLIRNHFDALL